MSSPLPSRPEQRYKAALERIAQFCQGTEASRIAREALAGGEVAHVDEATAERVRAIVQELVTYDGGMEYDDWRMFVQRAREALGEDKL